MRLNFQIDWLRDMQQEDKRVLLMAVRQDWIMRIFRVAFEHHSGAHNGCYILDQYI
jgi:hypothetical protein